MLDITPNFCANFVAIELGTAEIHCLEIKYCAKTQAIP